MSRPAHRPAPLVAAEVLESRALLTDVFALHSLPGAAKTIYLDFDGHTTSGTLWNDAYNKGAAFTTPAYSTDADKAAFSDAELAAIGRIWERVAEDYAPFQVDVTTQDPGRDALYRSDDADEVFGVRVVIGGSNSQWLHAAAGGIAFTGSFYWAGYGLPAYVFEDNLGSNEKNIAEAISHESGHTLGLSHDGVATATAWTEYYKGGSGWAPIMGNSYGQALTQWSRGEYANASNTEDDLAILSGGLGYRADDHGDTFAAATPLAGLSAAGLISTRADKDVFSFDLAGPGKLALAVNGIGAGSNLDVLAEVYDAAGNRVAVSDPTNGTNATFSLTLAAGRYYLVVDGTGKGDPHTTGYSDYGSLGRYTVSGSFAADPPPTPAVSGATARFDFGTASSPLSAGYTRVSEGTKYTAALGYGWLSGTVQSRDRSFTADPLKRDLDFSADATFAVDLPDGSYWVTVTMGDAANLHDQMGVYLEGSLVDTVTTATNQFVTRTFLATVADGQLTLRLRDLGGKDPNFVINALAVSPAEVLQGTSSDPAAATAAGVAFAGPAGVQESPAPAVPGQKKKDPPAAEAAPAQRRDYDDVFRDIESYMLGNG